MRKEYGKSSIDKCIFCDDNAFSYNDQRFPVCKDHKNAIVDMDKIKCSCKSYLDIKQGKYGTFFLCMNCGPVSIAKVKSINDIIDKNNPDFKKKTSDLKIKKTNSGEYTITTNDIDYF